jgi:ATP-dependent Clp protease ATP-binding subunit ClpB
MQEHIGAVLNPPRWLQDIRRLIPVRNQFLLSGNIRDFYLMPKGNSYVAMPILSCLHDVLTSEGYEFLVVYDIIDGICPFPDSKASRDLTIELLNPHDKKPRSSIEFSEDGHIKVSLMDLARHIQRVSIGERRVGFIIDYASRIAVDALHLSEAEREFFVSCEKLTQDPRARNAVIWLVNSENDIPSWYTVGNEGNKVIPVPLPDAETRLIAARQYAPDFEDFLICPKELQNSLVQAFTDLTESMTLRSMSDITALATTNEKKSFREIANLVRCFKVGIPDNPWKKDHMRSKILDASASIKGRVKGQSKAVEKTLDCLKRSFLGMTGAHASGNSGRPRGILFFAGPTGVGKTELAKAITAALFSDEKAYIRFDMSEFSAEHSDARLIGSPPGYEGHQMGGELTNAIRLRPASVVLFDEIEKAHPRILDKFLQILEDGRLTDGRGDTVFFSEAIIVFTSNLGIYVPEYGPDGQFIGRKQLVSPGMDYREVEAKVREAIENHFRYELSRPELLNRFGDNIIVFNFIEPDIAEQIFDKMLGSIANRLAEEHKIALSITDPVRKELLSLCISDLSNGGRGIGNRLEAAFVNPISRALFSLADLEERRHVEVFAINKDEAGYSLEIR